MGRPLADAVCVRCGAEKDLPLGRCGACGHLPQGDERELAVLASRRLLDEDGLRAVQERIRKGEALRPSAARREQARTLLRGSSEAPVDLTPRQVWALVAANVLVTPALGFAVWFRLRRSPGRGARQALWATVPISLGFGLAWLAWAGVRFRSGA